MRAIKKRFGKPILYLGIVGVSLFSFLQCTTTYAEKAHVAPKKVVEEVIPEPPDPTITYRLVATKDTLDWLLALEQEDTLTAILAINRVDRTYVRYLDTLIFPDTILPEIDFYSPFPKKVAQLEDVHKILFVSHFAQAFAVYENGKRIKWGPVNLGTKYRPTPVGLFATNWKAKRTTSTVDPSWILDWYFNLANFDGIGMHQYALPGYPASHGCVRMYRDDAYWLYHWADQWVVEDNKVAVYGTPVVIFEAYPYGERKPWLNLAEDKEAMTITPEALMTVMEEYLPTVMERQTKRDSVEMPQVIQ